MFFFFNLVFVGETVRRFQVEEFLSRKPDMKPKRAQALSQARWTSMKFSADGQSILIATDASLVLTLGAFEGDVKQVVFLGFSSP